MKTEQLSEAIKNLRNGYIGQDFIITLVVKSDDVEIANLQALEEPPRNVESGAEMQTQQGEAPLVN